MKKRLIGLVGLALSNTVMASVYLSNQDAQQYKLLLSANDSCSSGTHTQINGNTTASAPEGWACFNGAAVKLESGKDYIIKNGQIRVK